MFNKIFIRYEESLYKKLIPQNKMKKFIKKIFKILNIKACSISIYLTNDQIVKELNFKYLKKNKPTDVLSFSQLDDNTVGKELKNTFLGDIVISIPFAERNSKTKKHSILHEVYFLILHGILHIIGYDHEGSDEKIMFELQEKIFYDITGVKIEL